MGEQQSTGNGDEDGKCQPATAGRDAAGLHAPLKYRQSDDHHGEKAMQQDFGIREGCPETDRAERPRLRVAAEKEKCREAKEGERPIAGPGDSSRLRDQGQ